MTLMCFCFFSFFFFFFFNDTATTEIYTLSLHDALPIASDPAGVRPGDDELRGRERSDARLIEQLRRQRSGERLDLARELALFGGQVLDAASDRAQGLQRAAQLDVAVE